ncbi:MAG TPA: alanine--glyoxylate aminotransferase family protein [Candidatus Eisenbacteria bacterium]|jgi:aspartate aminotransferase-like enzyme|nr:alanine--glyoxylate aminotransferase family protein [Candidatus Eisenbacteria bacterium]
MNEFLLLTPGPTNVPKRILDKTALPMIHHRTKEFQAILERVNANLQKVFLTKHPVMTFAASGTGAMEGSITNLLSPGDTVLSFSAGKWGERYRDIAKAYGMDVKSYELPYGTAVDPAQLEAALKENPKAKAVLVTLCETSTAVTHPVQKLAAVTQKSGAMLFVDAISGLACDPLKMDEWGIDVVVCGSQKGFMLPPGLAFCAVNERAQAAIASSKTPKYYFNFADTIKALKKNDTPFTSAVSLYQGLDEALKMLLEEGIENVWKRHADVAAWTRQKVSALGLELFSKAPSNGLTAIVMPQGIDSKGVINHMRDAHRVVMADGQGELQGKIVRFAHMGYACTPADAQRGYDAFVDGMTKAGFKAGAPAHARA